MQQTQDPSRYSEAMREYRYVIQREPELAPYRNDVGGLLEGASSELAAAKATHELTGHSRFRRRVRDAASG